MVEKRTVGRLAGWADEKLINGRLGHSPNGKQTMSQLASKEACRFLFENPFRRLVLIYLAVVESPPKPTAFQVGPLLFHILNADLSTFFQSISLNI
jgi:hypothetical protein